MNLHEASEGPLLVEDPFSLLNVRLFVGQKAAVWV